MKLEQQYQELLRLKEEINQRLEAGTDFQKIRELILYLAQDGAYFKLKSVENQLIMLEAFFGIWLKEKKKLSGLDIEEDIFYRISCLNDVERKYQRVKFCGLRIENAVPQEYVEQALDWMKEDEISGLAMGKIIASETKDREENILFMARCLRKREDPINALLLLQYANEVFPEQENLLLEEADIWLDGNQLDRALELLKKIKNPSQNIKTMITELQQVIGNG